MSLCRFLLRSLRRSSTADQTLLHHRHILQNPLIPFHRTMAYSSAEEAEKERRLRKRRLRIEPPLHALRRDPRASRPPPDPNAPRLPDTTSALVGPRLTLHNRVQSLRRAGDLDNASAVARQSVFSNTRPTVFTCNAITAAMLDAKRHSDVIALFTYFFNQSNIVPNVVSYNILIKTHCEIGEVDKSLEVYRHIIANAPFSPSHVTYRHLTKGLVDADRINDAVDLLREMLNKGQGADSFVYNNVISGFLELGNLEKANEFFDELKERCAVWDGIVNATYMEWFFKRGRDKEAMESYRSLLDKNFRMVPPTCNALLEVLLKYGKKAEAEALFDSMLDNHTPPVIQAVNSDTFNIMVNECFKLGKVSEAYAVFKKAGKAPKSKPFSMDTAGYNNMIARYCEHEMMEDAEKMFAELVGKSLSPDVSTYRSLIDGYFKVGKVDDALEKYIKMVDAGLRVIPTYANTWFSGLIEKGKIVECASILTSMGVRDPKPDAMSYDLVIRSLCGIGNFDTSLDLLEQMIKYSVGVTPELKEFVLEAFDKVGRKEEVEQLLNTRFPRYAGNVPQYRNGQQSGNGQQYGSRPQYGNGQQYGNRAQDGSGNQHGSRPYYGNGQQYGSMSQYGNGQQYESRPYNGNGQQHGSSSQDGNGQQHGSSSHDGNGQKYESRQQVGNGWWSGSGTQYGNGQQYESRQQGGNKQWPGSGSQYGNGQQYSRQQDASGEQYGRGTQDGKGQLFGSGVQYGSRQQYGSASNGQQGGSELQYENRQDYGNAQQYGNAQHYGNAPQYGSQAQYPVGGQYKGEQQQGADYGDAQQYEHVLPQTGSVAA